ncbi:MAG: hypothetical protein Tsb0016_26170 [Sphingomonadales bacterium]
MTEQPPQPKTWSAWRWLWLPAIAVLVALVAAAAWLWMLRADFQSPGPALEPEIVILEPGTSLGGAARLLARQGVVADAWRFKTAALLFGGAKPILAGEYEVPARASAAAVLAILQSGQVVHHRFTLPEGSTVAETVARLRAEPLLRGEVAATPPEGSLLPETYYFVRHDQRQALLTRMRTAMDQTLRAAWAQRAAGLPLEAPEQALILASIVERETALPEERPRIAAVFINRLQRGMRLQSDPTVIYGIAGGKLDRPLSRTDLRTATPYNTYVIDGLPPGPIANPGRAALHAVLNPIASDELYFVADGTGGHVFARTHREHLRNVAAWRRIEAQRRAQEEP